MPYNLALTSGGAKVEFYTRTDLAKISGRTKNSITKLTSKGYLPEANFRMPDKVFENHTVKGESLYSKEFLVPHIMTFLNGITQGKPVTIEQRTFIHQQFELERTKVLSL